jgi:hypothetical protein
VTRQARPKGGAKQKQGDDDMHVKTGGREHMDSYIVRIYRRCNEPEVTGMVEFPERDTSQPFHSFEELRSILRGDKPGKARRAKIKSGSEEQ